jgi:hypothetical protein
MTAPRKPCTMRRPRYGTRVISRVWPGSKRTAVPAAMSRRLPRGSAVEGERGVGLGEMVVAADLDRPVAGVGDGQGDARQAGIQLDVAVGGEDFAGNQGS